MTELFSEKAIKEKVKELGQRIRADYIYKPLSLVLATADASFFLVDLARELDAGMVQMHAYPGTCIQAQGQHMLMVSLTAPRDISEAFRGQAESIKTISLLSTSQYPSDYTGFQSDDLPGGTWVGYGLADHNNQYSNLKFIATLSQPE